MVEQFRDTRTPKTVPQADEYVRTMVRRLRAVEFVRTQELPWAEWAPVLCDVYGVRDRAGDWYVKLYVHRETLVVSSCHPPEFPLRRVDGLRLGRSRQ